MHSSISGAAARKDHSPSSNPTRAAWKSTLAQRLKSLKIDGTIQYPAYLEILDVFIDLYRFYTGIKNIYDFRIRRLLDGFLENQTYAYKRTIQLLSLLKIVDIHLGLQRFISVSAYPKMLLFLKAGYLETEPSCVTRLSISTIFEIT